MTLEILIPVRNPTEVFDKTVESLALQTDKNFSVLISDNFSTKGQEHLAAALEKLAAAGLAARQIQPPMELERVEHWNWAHHQSQGDWLKPLFVGDWLEPDYVARLRAAAAHPGCHYVFSNYTLHRTGRPPQLGVPRWGGRFVPAAEMRALVLRDGMQFGPPSVAAYQRDAFLAVGCYATALPITADSLLFCTLAASFGALGLDERLCHFNIHNARFSTSLPQKRRDTLRETMTYCWLLAYHAWTDNVAFSRVYFARLLARAWRDHVRGR